MVIRVITIKEIRNKSNKRTSKLKDYLTNNNQSYNLYIKACDRVCPSRKRWPMLYIEKR